MELWKRKFLVRLISELDNDIDIESDIEGNIFIIINFYISNLNLVLFWNILILNK